MYYSPEEDNGMKICFDEEAQKLSELFPTDSDVPIDRLGQENPKASSFDNGHHLDVDELIPTKDKKQQQQQQQQQQQGPKVVRRQVDFRNNPPPPPRPPPPPLAPNRQPYSYGYPNLYPPPGGGAAPPPVVIHNHHHAAPQPPAMVGPPYQFQVPQQSLGGSGGFTNYGGGSVDDGGVDYEVDPPEAADEDAPSAGDDEEEEEAALEEAVQEILKKPLTRWKTHNFHGATEGQGSPLSYLVLSLPQIPARFSCFSILPQLKHTAGILSSSILPWSFTLDIYIVLA